MLREELRAGYQDRIAINGLDNFMLLRIPPFNNLKELSPLKGKSYATATVAERKSWLEKAIQVLQGWIVPESFVKPTSDGDIRLQQSGYIAKKTRDTATGDNFRRRLLKYLSRELATGCQDRYAELGGVDNYSLLRTPPFDSLKQLTPLKGGSYADADTTKRKNWLTKAIQTLLNQSTPKSLSKPTSDGVTQVQHPRFISKKPRDVSTDDNSRRRLLGYLEKELEAGCQDRYAEFGGVDGFIIKKTPSLAHLKQLPPLKGGSYAATPVAKRKVWLEKVIQTLQKQPATESLPKSVSDDGTRGTLPGFIFRETRNILTRLDILTIKDLLMHVPRDYNDFSTVVAIKDAPHGEELTVRGSVIKTATPRIGAAGKSFKAFVRDDSGTLEVTWFGRWDLERRIEVGKTLLLSGKVTVYRDQKGMSNPEYELFETVQKRGSTTHVGGLVPVYPATQKLTQRMLRAAIRQVLDRCDLRQLEWLPDTILNSAGQPYLTKALPAIHFPKDLDDAERARQRLVFDEFLRFQLGIQQLRVKRDNSLTASALRVSRTPLEWYNDQLGFELTEEQRATLQIVLGDMGCKKPMFRMVQGEVGAGKTVVALGAMLGAVAAGYKALLLAPTEVLADQHLISAINILGAKPPLGYPQNIAVFQAPGVERSELRIGLLTSKQTTKAKQRFKELAAQDGIDLMIGTHALLQEDLKLKNIALVVIDEQHRFGVRQRGMLSERHPSPHILTMSATPIPRSMQMMAYGDMQVSTIKQTPFVRQVTTEVCFQQSDRERAYGRVKEQIASGRQAFIVCPFIDPSDKIEARSVTTEFERLRSTVFADLRVAMLHGEMKLKEKIRLAHAMYNGELDILVATQIIEVGVDVPNATVMLIESSERFGLAQLHQLRGRVGRSGDAGYCYLLSDSASPSATERLLTLTRYTDGFSIAEADLKMRGPGDYIGTRQSGWNTNSSIARLQDAPLIEQAADAANAILKADPQLKKSPRIAAEMRAFWNTRTPQTA